MKSAGFLSSTSLNACAKRTIDLVVASCVLVLSAPLFVLAAAGIKVSSLGPVFYRARRVGRDGKVFAMLKFRSMRVNSDSTSPITALGDSRIFPFGRFLRATKIDELPQLLNILVGDMSLVGPRPEDPEIVEAYYDDRMRLSLLVRPGLTSPGTILYMRRFHHAISADNALGSYVSGILREKLEADIAYLNVDNVFKDTSLIVRTAGLILAKFIRSPGQE